MRTVDKKCPKCGYPGLSLTLELGAVEIGEFSLAGVGMKFSVQELPRLRCLSCDWSLWGEIDQEDGKAVFHVKEDQE